MSYIPEQIPTDLLKLTAAGAHVLEQVHNGNLFSEEPEAKRECVDAFDALAITLHRAPALFPTLVNPLDRYAAEIASNNALYALCVHLANGIPITVEQTFTHLGIHEADVAIEIIKAFQRNGRNLFANHTDFFKTTRRAA